MDTQLGLFTFFSGSGLATKHRYFIERGACYIDHFSLIFERVLQLFDHFSSTLERIPYLFDRFSTTLERVSHFFDHFSTYVEQPSLVSLTSGQALIYSFVQ